VSSATPLFRFIQVELPWTLGPPDGRYLLRPPDASPGAEPSHVLVLATLGAPERRHLERIRRNPEARPEPEPTPVATSRATVIDTRDPISSPQEARAQLARAGEAELREGIAVLNRALHAFRLVTEDPYLHGVDRAQAIVARVGFGAGEQVAAGLWTEARELPHSPGRRRRSRVLAPQARLAAVLSGRESVLACEELALRVELDLESDRDREAALQLLVALDAALAELAADPVAEAISERLAELRAQRDAATSAAQAALAGPLSDAQRSAVRFTLSRIVAALRARAALNARAPQSP
jgi:hypothetical protein